MQILNIIIITITLLLINYNVIVSAITNFGNTIYNAKYAYHAEKLSHSDSCFLERELPLM